MLRRDQGDPRIYQFLLRVEDVERRALSDSRLLAHAVERDLRRVDLRGRRFDLGLGGVELAPALHHRGPRLIAVDVEIEPLLAERFLGLTNGGVFGAALIDRYRQLTNDRGLRFLEDFEGRVRSLQHAPRQRQAWIERAFA